MIPKSSPRLAGAIVLLMTVLAQSPAHAHSASDAYVTLVEQPHSGPATAQTVLHVQWDIALRDLDFVLKLDDNGDGRITWGELRRHQDQIAQYAYRYLTMSGDGKSCRLSPTGQLVDDHADGAYSTLLFDVICAGPVQQLNLDYRLFFGIDPSHRAIVVFRNGDTVATALMSSDKTRLDFKL